MKMSDEALALERLNPTLREKLRDRAVETVDGRHRYTIEFAPGWAAHAAEYDAEETRLIAEVADDPGQIICQHEHRIHSLGGAMRVCFGCWARLLLGSR